MKNTVWISKEYLKGQWSEFKLENLRIYASNNHVAWNMYIKESHGLQVSVYLCKHKPSARYSC